MNGSPSERGPSDPVSSAAVAADRPEGAENTPPHPRCRVAVRGDRGSRRAWLALFLFRAGPVGHPWASGFCFAPGARSLISGNIAKRYMRKTLLIEAGARCQKPAGVERRSRPGIKPSGGHGRGPLRNKVAAGE